MLIIDLSLAGNLNLVHFFCTLDLVIYQQWIIFYAFLCLSGGKVIGLTIGIVGNLSDGMTLVQETYPTCYSYNSIATELADYVELECDTTGFKLVIFFQVWQNIKNQISDLQI